MGKYSFVSSLLLAALSMAACSNEEGMGTDLMPSTDMASIRVVDTITINASTELDGLVNTVNSSYLLSGHYTDPIFGETDASFVAKFSNTSYGKFDAASVCDSVVLTMGMDTTSLFYYGELGSPVTMEVYELGDSLRQNENYNQSSVDKLTMGGLLATTTFTPSKKDTLVKFVLDPAYGNKVIAAVNSSSFASNIHGLYFKVISGNCITRFYRASKYTQYLV